MKWMIDINQNDCSCILKPFEECIQNICDKLTFCTLELYKTIIKDLPPTPSKFHYIFNLRDLSRIYNGLTMTNPERLGVSSFRWIRKNWKFFLVWCLQYSITLYQWFWTRRPGPTRGFSKLPRGLQDDLKSFKLTYY